MNKTDVRDLIAKSHLDEAIEAMKQMAKGSRHQNDVLLLSARLREIEQEKRRGTQSAGELNRSRNQITQALLALLDELPEGAGLPRNHVAPKNEIHTNPPIKGNFMKNLLFAIAAILGLAAIYFLFAWLKAEPQNKEPFPALLSAISTLILLFVAWQYDGSDAQPPGNSPFFRANKADIKGKNITVKQGNKGRSAIETNRLKADGEDHDIEQG